MVMILRRIVGLRNENSGTFGPLSRQRSRLFLSPTGSWQGATLGHAACAAAGTKASAFTTEGDQVFRMAGFALSDGTPLPRRQQPLTQYRRTGLGPAIVKHVLERHGAELEISSKAGHGTTFTCRFPATSII